MYFNGTRYFSDCIAPYEIDIEFDAISDKLTTMDNDLTSCGKFDFNGIHACKMIIHIIKIYNYGIAIFNVFIFILGLCLIYNQVRCWLSLTMIVFFIVQKRM